MLKLLKVLCTSLMNMLITKLAAQKFYLPYMALYTASYQKDSEESWMQWEEYIMS